MMKQIRMLALCLTLVSVGVQAQQATTDRVLKTSKRKASTSSTAIVDRLNHLQEAIDVQQQQITQLRDQVQNRDQQI
jgi:hypothetical protein